MVITNLAKEILIDWLIEWYIIITFDLLNFLALSA